MAGPSPCRSHGRHPLRSARIDASHNQVRLDGQVPTKDEVFTGGGCQDGLSTAGASVLARVCVNSTPTNTARTELHSMITFHHANTRGSSSRIAHLCPQNKCHPHVMSRPLPHLTLTTSTSSLSHPFHPLLLPFRGSHHRTQALRLSTLKYPAMFHGRAADQNTSHLSQVMSPNRLRIRPSTPKISSLKTSSPEELSLTESWDRSVSMTGKIYEKLCY